MTSLLAALTVTVFMVQAPPVNPQAEALSDFVKRLEAYLSLREALVKKLEPLSPTASATELQARVHALAAGLRLARTGARQGDLIPPLVQQQIRATVLADLKRRTPEAKRAAFAEVPTGPPPGVNQNYPEQAALPPVPPLLLASLPKLPDGLQYCFFGRYVVILDSDVEIVVDYVANAVPR